MAKLPRYRPLGASIPSLPSVDYVGVGRAQARVAQTVSQQLDQMASFAFREAEVQAKIEGAEFGAANAPSAEQLQEATTPEAREELVPGGPGTVFDRAARSAALRSIANDLDTSAREEIANLRMTASSENMSVSDLQAQIDGVINGYAGAVYDVSPELASNFRAGIAASGNSALVAHASSMAKEAEEQRERNAIRGIDGLIQEIPDLVERGDYLDNNGNKVSLDEVLRSQEEKFFSKAENLSASMLSSKLTAYRTAISEAKAGVIIDHVFEDEFAISDIGRVSKMRQGNFGDKTTLFNSLSPADQAKIRSSIRERISAREADMKIYNEQSDDNLASRFASLVQRYNDAVPGSDDEMTFEDEMFDIAIKSNNRVTNPSAINGIVSSKRTRLASNDRQPTNKLGKGLLTQEIYQEKIQSNEQLIARAEELDVPANDYASLFAKVKSFRDADYKNGVSKINRAAKISPGSGAVPTGTQIDKVISYTNKMEDTYAERYQEWEDGGMVGLAPSYEDIADEITTAAQESKFTKAIENKFSSLSGTYPELRAYFSEERFEELLDIVNDAEVLETMGLSKKEIKLLQSQYQLDAAFIRNNINSRDGL